MLKKILVLLPLSILLFSCSSTESVDSYTVADEIGINIPSSPVSEESGELEPIEDWFAEDEEEWFWLVDDTVVFHDDFTAEELGGDPDTVTTTSTTADDYYAEALAVLGSGVSYVDQSRPVSTEAQTSPSTTVAVSDSGTELMQSAINAYFFQDLAKEGSIPVETADVPEQTVALDSPSTINAATGLADDVPVDTVVAEMASESVGTSIAPVEPASEPVEGASPSIFNEAIVSYFGTSPNIPVEIPEENTSSRHASGQSEMETMSMMTVEGVEPYEPDYDGYVRILAVAGMALIVVVFISRLAIPRSKRAKGGKRR